MRNLSITVNKDGLPTKIVIRKVPQEKRFLVQINNSISEYILTDEKNTQVEYHDGVELEDYIFEKVREMILQYFPKVRGIKPAGVDDYSDYDDY